MNKLSDWLFSSRLRKKKRLHGKRTPTDLPPYGSLSNSGDNGVSDSHGRHSGINDMRSTLPLTLVRLDNGTWQLTEKRHHRGSVKGPIRNTRPRLLIENCGYSSAPTTSRQRCDMSLPELPSLRGDFRGYIGSPPLPAPLCQLNHRKLIRTNPWIHPKPPQSPILDLWGTLTPPPRTSTPLLNKRMHEQATLKVPLVDDSSSSGYSSHDSSPESSMHSPSWALTPTKEDAIDPPTKCKKQDKSVSCQIEQYDDEYFEEEENMTSSEPLCPECDNNGNIIDWTFQQYESILPSTDQMLADLDRKLSKIQEKTTRVQVKTSNAQEEHDYYLKSKEAIALHISFLRDIKWVIRAGSEVNI